VDYTSFDSNAENGSVDICRASPFLEIAYEVSNWLGIPRGSCSSARGADETPAKRPAVAAAVDGPVGILKKQNEKEAERKRIRRMYSGDAQRLECLVSSGYDPNFAGG